jgi:hypothetical protein
MNGTSTSYAAVLMMPAGQVAQQRTIRRAIRRAIRRVGPVTSGIEVSRSFAITKN